MTFNFVPADAGQMVGGTFIVVAVASLAWSRVAHWAVAALEAIRGGD